MNGRIAEIRISRCQKLWACEMLAGSREEAFSQLAIGGHLFEFPALDHAENLLTTPRPPAHLAVTNPCGPGTPLNATIGRLHNSARNGSSGEFHRSANKANVLMSRPSLRRARPTASYKSSRSGRPTTSKSMSAGVGPASPL